MAVDLVFLEQKLDTGRVAVHALFLEDLHGFEIESRLDLDAHGLEAVTGLFIKLGCVQQGFRGDTAHIEAGAAMGLALLDDSNLHSQLRGANGAHIAAGTSTDDNEIVSVSHFSYPCSSPAGLTDPAPCAAGLPDIP